MLDLCDHTLKVTTVFMTFVQEKFVILDQIRLSSIVSQPIEVVVAVAVIVFIVVLVGVVVFVHVFFFSIVVVAPVTDDIVLAVVVSIIIMGTLKVGQNRISNSLNIKFLTA